MKDKGGRPSGFTEPLANRILELAKKGMTDVQIASAIGVALSTLSNWKAAHPDFLEALKDSKSIADDLVRGALLSRALGYVHPAVKFFYDKDDKKVIVQGYAEYYPPDTTACIFWLKNRQPAQWRERSEHLIIPDLANQQTGPKTFEKFCAAAGYPLPLPKQCDMREFVFDAGDEPRMLLGSRGYGKTDYVTILGTAFKIYSDPQYRVLIITKSDEKNASIVAEITKALIMNGVILDKDNAHCIRVSGLHGKDHSVSAITVGSTSLRGRHPDMAIMDDPVTEEDVSEATRARLQRKYNELTKLCKKIVIIGQPVHVFDLYETLRPLLKGMEVPHGTIPELDHDLVAMRLAGVSETSINASYHLKVVSETGNPFAKVQHLDKMPGGETVAFMDPSFRGGDYTALSIGRQHFDGMAIQGRAWKRSWEDCLDDLKKDVIAFNIRRLCFETNCLGNMPLAIIRAHLTGLNCVVIGRDSQDNKHARIMAAGVFAKYIFLAKTSDRIYIDHVTKYEYKSKFDDAPDSLASLLAWIGLIRGKK